MPFAPAAILGMSPSFYVPIPFAVDNSVMLLCMQDWGIACEDSTFYENFNAYQPGTPTYMQHMSPYGGPMSGGTASTGFGNAFSFPPDVWYGTTRGTAKVDGAGTLTITSPSASAPGPVNVKLLFPDGNEVFNPLFFSYGPYPQYAVLSGASPDGGVPGEIAGYGLPTDASGGTVTVGGNAATITTQTSQYLPFTGAPFPSTFLNFTIPPGPPGWADISVKTSEGSGVLPAALFYAQSVKDYPSSDSFNAILYDARRQQLYLSAQDHIDVFSLTSNEFVTPLTPVAQGSQKQFAGLALTPDGSLLLAENLADGSLAVINPDQPSSSSVIPIAPESTGNSGCKIGPLYIAAAMNQRAFVVTGALPSGNTCAPGGIAYQVNLALKSVNVIPNGNCGGGNVVASLDGTIVAFGENPAGYGAFCTYNASQNTFSFGGDYRASATISGDGNVTASQWMLADSSANILGWVAQPATLYQTSGSAASTLYAPLLQPKMNDAGSLYYVAAPTFVDIIDVQHGLLRLRFSLSETGSNVASTGTKVAIRGSGFSPGLTATVGGQVASVALLDANTLTLTMPPLQSGPKDIQLKQVDGSTYIFESGITVP